MARIILHVDLNAFFVRAEEIKNPSLENKAVIIGRRGRKGVVSTCSYKARELGVSSGMPTFKALELCPNAILIDGDYRYYNELSTLFINYLKRYSKIIEQTSIDECFMDMTNQLKHQKDVLSYLKMMQLNLLKETGLKCSIGVGPTKFLAKMASDLKKPMGITIIRRKDARSVLAPLPIDNFYGIGKKTAPKLKEIGILTIKDLIDAIDNNSIIVHKILGKFYYAIKDWINGYGNDLVDASPRDPKSIGNSNTLMHDSRDIEELKHEISLLVDEVSKRSKEAGKVGTTVQLTLKDNDFKVISRSKTIDKASNDVDVIISVAYNLLEQVYHNEPIRLVGVALSNLKNESDYHEQMSIFDDYEKIKEECATKLLIGEINRKFNKGVVKTAMDYLKEQEYVKK